MLKYIGFLPLMDEFTCILDEGADAVLLTVRLVPLVPAGKFTVAPADGKLRVDAVDEELRLPVLPLRAKATPISGDVVR
jgi:hypothetical protein